MFGRALKLVMTPTIFRLTPVSITVLERAAAMAMFVTASRVVMMQTMYKPMLV